MPLRKADLTSTRRFEDGKDWIVLRVGGLTKAEADHVADLSAALKIDPQALAGESPEVGASIEIEKHTHQANRALIEILCDSWSLKDDDGNAIPVSAQAYSDLDNESGQWVDKCISEVLAERRKRAEGNVPSPRKPRARASSSGKAAA